MFINQIEVNIRNLLALRSDQNLLGEIDKAINLISDTLQKGLPLLVCGNGGSAADALHISGELVGRFNVDRKGYNIICLNTNSVFITAWSNDIAYDSVFSRQVQAHGSMGGVLWGLSTSGNSPSVVQAFNVAQELGLKTIALTGSLGGKLAHESDILIKVPSVTTPRIQEMHVMIYHYICAEVEKILANDI